MGGFCSFWTNFLPPGQGAEFTRFLHKAVYGMAMGHRYKLDFGKYSLIHKIFVGGGWLLQAAWCP